MAELSEQEIAELTALADGTLPPERAALVEARVAASPRLQELVEHQRLAVAATRALESEPVPDSLRASVEAGLRTRAPKRRPLRLSPRFALGGAVAVAAVVTALLLTSGPGAPSVAQAASIASRPPTGPAPRPRAGETDKLAVGVQGVSFPNLAAFAGWHATGVRRDRLDGRSATVVFYAKGGRRIGYVIVSRPALPRPGGTQNTTFGGNEYQLLRIDGRPAVTWRRGAHTCVLIGQATHHELVELASWPFTRSP